MTKEMELPATPTALDLTLSLSVAEKIQADLKRCWANALRALRTQPTLKNAWYVEGWAILDFPFPIEHGWVELPDTRIVDPTYALILNREIAPESMHPVYFAGAKYTRGTLKGLRVSKLPHVYTFGGWGGFEHEPYKQAYFSAWAHCGRPDILPFSTK